MAELITVPNFTFLQGDIYEEDTEHPIQVLYWNGGDAVELRQGDNEVLIRTSLLNKLFKEVKKHLPEATQHLKAK